MTFRRLETRSRKRPQSVHSLYILPDKRRVELSVDKDHHLKGHGDPQPTDAGHHRLQPEHTCRGQKNRSNQFKSDDTSACPLRLTLRNEGGDEAGGSGHDVGGGEGKASAEAFDGEQDEKGSGELLQTGDEEVDVDVSSQNTQPHDQALVDHSTGEPGRDRGGMAGVAPKMDQHIEIQC